MLINTGADPNDPERLTLKADDFSMRPPEKMIEDFKEIPEAILNTQKIVELCDFKFELGKTKLPQFETPNGKTPDEYLKELCYQGLEKRFGKNVEKGVIDRLEYELSVIKQTGFASYFLIVQDFVNWAKQNRIVVGPGRGSVGGSLVAYLLNITNVDPIKYDLLFERFLNPSRVSLPDIDLDFADRRRDEVIEYVREKYGKEKVAQIITFGTMAARAVVRDVGRALSYPYPFCDQIAKMIPFGLTLDETLAKISEFRQLYEMDPKAQKLIEFARKLEGCARHASTHACGVVISSEPLDNICPLQHPTQDDKAIVTQYEMHSIEDLGLLKMDFLGLKNLTIIEDTLSRIYAIQNKKIDIENIPLNDKLTYKLLQKGETIGVFQLESEGMRKYLKQLKPTELEDIVAMVALYRPGPIQFIPDYIAGKHKKKKVEYLHPKLKPILEKTYGICVYQEQLMQIARDLAGFSLAEADVLRKAIGKKIKSLFLEQEKKLIEGMRKNGISESVAKRIWQWVLPFAHYGFNRSHSCAYALIAYQTAYLKAHFPVEFMSALLTSEQADVERIGFLIEECKKMGIEVLPPDINESWRNFTAIPGKKQIRFGLLAIKNVGVNFVEAVIEERKNRGPFQSIEDFLLRINSKDLNKKSLESLIKAGVFDKFAERNLLLNNLENLLEFNRENQKTKFTNQKGLFDKFSFKSKIQLQKTKPASKSEKLAWEKELLGLFVSSHPLEDFKNIFEEKITKISEINSHPNKNNHPVKIGGIISKIKKIVTRNGKPMLFMNIEDLSDKIEVIVFPGAIERNPKAFQENKIVFVSGKLDNRDGVPKLICQDIEEVIENA
jgi:DNA polymerase-3 subunit alpha